MTTQREHAFLSASGSSRWLTCEVSPWREAPCHDTSGEAAKRGTALHTLRAHFLKGESLPDMVDGYDTAALWPEIAEHSEALKATLAHADEVHIEKPLLIEGVTGEPDAHGTPDLVYVIGNTLAVEDLKTGHVRVDASDNSQLMIYAAAALDAYDPLGMVDIVELRISQGEVGSIAVYTVAEVQDVKAEILAKGKRILTHADSLVATPELNACRYCKAAATCPELAALVEETTAAVPDDIQLLDAMMRAIPLVEVWIKAVQAEVYRRLEAGDEFPSYMLGYGREGNRKWASEEEVEKLRKKTRVLQDQVYERVLMSPAKVQKVLKDSPETWGKFEALVERSAAKLCVLPKSKGAKAGKTLDEMFEKED